MIDDVHTHLSHALPADGLTLIVLGETKAEFDGSEWAHVVHAHLGGQPPQPDLEAEANLAEVLITAANQGLVSAAHDISDGGLAQAVVEMCLRGNCGATLNLTGDAFTQLWSESVARAVVALTAEQAAELLALALQHGVPAEVIGTSGGTSFVVNAPEVTFSIAVDQLREVHTATLPALFDH